MTIVSIPPAGLDIRCVRPAGSPALNVTAHRGGERAAALTRSVNTPGEAFVEAQRIAAAAAVAAGPCPPWCITGPHEAFPTDPYDDGARLHTGADVTMTVRGSSVVPVDVIVSPEWMQDPAGVDAEPPAVYVNCAEDGQTRVELKLTPGEAEALAAQLVATARTLRATVTTEAVNV